MGIFNRLFEKSLKSNTIIRKTSQNRLFYTGFCSFYVNVMIKVIARNVFLTTFFYIM